MSEGVLFIGIVLFWYSFVVLNQRRYDMRHEMLTQRALFCHRANTKRGTLTQRFVMHVVPPLVLNLAS